LQHIGARTLQVNDVHRHVINLARVAAHPRLGPKLYRHLRRLPHHPDALRDAQRRCVERENDRIPRSDLYTDENPPSLQMDFPDFEWAADYMIAAWCSRHGSAGTDGEFKSGLSLRWNADGGDSCAHFRGATKALVGWRRILDRANFATLDFREFLAKCKDEPGHGIYCDPPFPGPGDGYKHKFTLKDHQDLSRLLGEYRAARVVCRFYDRPLVRELYPDPRWNWLKIDGGRKQTNATAPEVLILNGRSLAESEAA
jgi:DNA adenine methylase